MDKANLFHYIITIKAEHNIVCKKDILLQSSKSKANISMNICMYHDNKTYCCL